jgi:hypothetical protein
MHQAGEAVTGIAANARTQSGVHLVEHHTQRSVKWIKPDRPEIFRQVLDARLMAYSRPWVGFPRGWFGRILATITMHLVQVFGLRVVRL